MPTRPGEEDEATVDAAVASLVAFAHEQLRAHQEQWAVLLDADASFGEDASCREASSNKARSK